MNFAVQSLCARIGIVTGRGLGGVIRDRYGRRWLAPVVLLLLVANVVNIGADIAAIAACVELLAGAPALALVAPIGIAIALTEILVPYALFARYLQDHDPRHFCLRHLCVRGQPRLEGSALSTFVPRVAMDRAMIATIVAILGTTISPYLFFWQVSQEVEEEREHGVVATTTPPAG